MNKSLAIRLLVISNVLVALASASQGFALFLHVDLIAYAASGIACVGAVFAIWQWVQANKELMLLIDDLFELERGMTDSRIELELELEKQKKREYTKFKLFLASGIIIGAILHYWFHPEKRVKA